mmetsp:Transcript_99176/g.251863  ORF Transcript_99176/g.251863 Transcript_99176/m.251863 type:complete len:248 (+) Transcript_99176:917-1660(+)
MLLLHVVLRPDVFRVLPGLDALVLLAELRGALRGLLTEVVLLASLLLQLLTLDRPDLPLAQVQVLLLGLIDSASPFRNCPLALPIDLRLELFLGHHVGLHSHLLLLLPCPRVLKLLRHVCLFDVRRLDQILDGMDVPLPALAFQRHDSLFSLLVVLLVALLALLIDVFLHLGLLPALGALFVDALLPRLRLQLLELALLLELGDEGLAVLLALHGDAPRSLLLELVRLLPQPLAFGIGEAVLRLGLR